MSSQTIVQVNASQQIAAAPSQLQRTSCFVSQGGTTLAAGSLKLLVDKSTLAPFLAGSNAISSISWATGTVSVTTTAGHGITIGDTVIGVITGCVPAGYNGTYTITSTGSSTFTYSLAVNPGTISTKGIFTTENIAELAAMNTTFWAQGSNNAVYVLELGAGTPAQGVTDLIDYLDAPQIPMYAYCLPTIWSDESTAITMARNYSADESKVYFYTTTTLNNYEDWTGIKSVVALNQDVSAPSTEHTIAGLMWEVINNAPSDVNKVAPMAFRYLVGVTEFSGTESEKVALKANKINYIGTGSEGGISKELILWGVTADGRDINQWYSADWVQINVALDVSNAVINGSNNTLNPLYFNQAGINTIQQIAQGTYNRGVLFGLALDGDSVDAVDLVTYRANNPSDYSIGQYNGLSLSFTTARGFLRITFNVTIFF